MRVSGRYAAMLALLLLGAAGVRFAARRGERMQAPPRASFAAFPASLGRWSQIDQQTLSPGELRELAADDTLSRTYRDADGATAYLFMAWYANQRHRRTFHSPQNCLPGAGWTMADHRVYAPPDAPTASDELDGRRRLNEYRLERDGARMIALYWYQGRGRMDASEYWGRLHTMADALVLGRTDGAIVRVIVPMERDGRSEEQARRAALDFVRELGPLLPAYLPD